MRRRRPSSADYRLADTDTARWFQRLVDGWLADKAAGKAVPDIGLSAVPWVLLAILRLRCAPLRMRLRPAPLRIR